MHKQYSLWYKLLRKNRPHLTPEETLSSRDRLRITQIILVVVALLFNVAIIWGISALS